MLHSELSLAEWMFFLQFKIVAQTTVLLRAQFVLWTAAFWEKNQRRKMEMKKKRKKNRLCYVYNVFVKLV